MFADVELSRREKEDLAYKEQLLKLAKEKQRLLDTVRGWGHGLRYAP